MEYQSGIAVHKGLLETVDHVISVVGWGKENDQQYWIVRNSWSTSWGEDGYLRLAINGNACGVANEATVAVVEEGE